MALASPLAVGSYSLWDGMPLSLYSLNLDSGWAGEVTPGLYLFLPPLPLTVGLELFPVPSLPLHYSDRVRLVAEPDEQTDASPLTYRN